MTRRLNRNKAYDGTKSNPSPSGMRRYKVVMADIDFVCVDFYATRHKLNTYARTIRDIVKYHYDNANLFGKASQLCQRVADSCDLYAIGIAERSRVKTAQRDARKALADPNVGGVVRLAQKHATDVESAVKEARKKRAPWSLWADEDTFLRLESIRKSWEFRSWVTAMRFAVRVQAVFAGMPEPEKWE